MGTAMMGPDYTQWHGNYEVAKKFYMEFVPQVRDAIAKAMASGDAKKAEAARKVQAELDATLNSEMHRWYLGKMTPEERENFRTDMRSRWCGGGAATDESEKSA